MSERRDELRDLYRGVQRILFEHWDPIEINSNRNLFDEYDAYIPDILKLAQNGCSEDQMVVMLLEMESLIPSASVARLQRRAVAGKILALFT